MATNQPLSPEKVNLRNAQGEAYQRALEYMQKETVNASVFIDDYIITVACEEAEGMYHNTEDGQTGWMIPHLEENQHLEVVIQDREDKRFIPNLKVHVKLVDAQGNLTEEKDVPFIWHPFLFHYGINWTIPKEGDYMAEVTVSYPSFHRHDENVGDRYKRTVTASVGPLHLVPERSEHGGE